MSGVGRVMDVLRLITEQRIQQAKHANPLTQLPGNVPIQQCLTRLLDQQREAVVCYVDIDGFKPFNDLYGYAKGDEVLLSLAQTLSERLDPQQDFVGHIGGDDFLVVLGSSDWRQRLNGLMAGFQERCRHFYRSEHLEAAAFSPTTETAAAASIRCCRCHWGSWSWTRRPASGWMPAAWPALPRKPSATPRGCPATACT